MIEEKLSGGVQSLEVGLSVLNALLEHNKPIILKELSSKLDMHPAKVHRYLVSLIRMNYAKQLDDGQYALGDQAWRLGLNCIQHTDVLQLVQHLIYELQSKIGCGIQISKWSPKGPLVVQSIESNHPISIVTKVGSIMPLVNSAAGRIFASYLPEAVIQPLIHAEWERAAHHHYPIKPANWDEFKNLKENILDNGMAIAQGDLLVGINAVGLPIFNAHQAMEFCIVALDSEMFFPVHEGSEKLELFKREVAAINQYIKTR
ncbi:IclR family transcriptional regulator [Acinetobacter haemolyticus]|uniref:IclR family transcriptional regulator n=1 Tax=Acinetobacter haemolyticus TaxID=29430 RepID=A0A1L6KPY1_ACIHA|nr:IclR family transcriptional regulator [Acinetobacter haemolyticus]APR71131.1 IclR family transcriptional regulator [Acinetobacter haemolyticus]AZN67186.1 IclR family transcriptional regulator [Acinetobacter haemolyticus]MBO3657805.1 IclR family transcriptional regulator [Acinetobacter haemolyticus]MCU4387729.1 IclR family transcriptional regulator [Acinetobacter haemolyticus]MEB6677232.1 IclR family transcriptional regulator [Acinetobacter haemolyticus]